MSADPIIYCLEQLSDYEQFERLCHDFLAGLGYVHIEPLGGFHDRGRDAVHTSASTGETTVFAYSVREEWLKKLREDAKKIKGHNHPCDKFVFVTTATLTANERDRAIEELKTNFDWTLDIFSAERLRIILSSTQASLISKHPAIFHPSFFFIANDRLPARDLRVQVNSTRQRREQLAQIRLFNAGADPILIDAWQVRWGANLDARLVGSIECITGRLPARLLAQSKADLLVSIKDVPLEQLTHLGVVDASGKYWWADEANIKQFISSAITHRPPPPPQISKPDEDELKAVEVGIKVRRMKRSGSPDTVEVVFSNPSALPIPISGACIEWEYDPPRGGPKVEGQPHVSEVSGSINLALLGTSRIVNPGMEAIFILRDEMANVLVGLLAPDVPDDKISVLVGTTTKFGWRASGDEIPKELRAAAQSIVDFWDRDQQR